MTYTREKWLKRDKQTYVLNQLLFCHHSVLHTIAAWTQKNWKKKEKLERERERERERETQKGNKTERSHMVSSI